jgi:hypothetical protein
MQITLGDLTDSRVIDLLHYHLTTARAETAREVRTPTKGYCPISPLDGGMAKLVAVGR